MPTCIRTTLVGQLYLFHGGFFRNSEAAALSFIAGPADETKTGEGYDLTDAGVAFMDEKAG